MANRTEVLRYRSEHEVELKHSQRPQGGLDFMNGARAWDLHGAPSGCATCASDYVDLSNQRTDTFAYSEQLSDEAATEKVVTATTEILEQQRALKGKIETHGDCFIALYTKLSQKTRAKKIRLSDAGMDKIPQTRNPDVELVYAAGDWIEKRKHRQTFLIPHVNIDALSNHPQTLFAFLNARAHRKIHNFVLTSKRAMAAGVDAGLVDLRFSDLYMAPSGEKLKLLPIRKSEHECTGIGFPKGELVLDAWTLEYRFLHNLMDVLIGDSKPSGCAFWNRQFTNGSVYLPQVATMSPLAMMSYTGPVVADLSEILDRAREREQNAEDEMDRLQTYPRDLLELVQCLVGTAFFAALPPPSESAWLALEVWRFGLWSALGWKAIRTRAEIAHEMQEKFCLLRTRHEALERVAMRHEDDQDALLYAFLQTTKKEATNAAKSAIAAANFLVMTTEKVTQSVFHRQWREVLPKTQAFQKHYIFAAGRQPTLTLNSPMASYTVWKPQRLRENALVWAAAQSIQDVGQGRDHTRALTVLAEESQRAVVQNSAFGRDERLTTARTDLLDAHWMKLQLNDKAPRYPSWKEERAEWPWNVLNKEDLKEREVGVPQRWQRGDACGIDFDTNIPTDHFQSAGELLRTFCKDARLLDPNSSDETSLGYRQQEIAARKSMAVFWDSIHDVLRNHLEVRNGGVKDLEQLIAEHPGMRIMSRYCRQDLLDEFEVDSRRLFHDLKHRDKLLRESGTGTLNADKPAPQRKDSVHPGDDVGPGAEVQADEGAMIEEALHPHDDDEEPRAEAERTLDEDARQQDDRGEWAIDPLAATEEDWEEALQREIGHYRDQTQQPRLLNEPAPIESAPARIWIVNKHGFEVVKRFFYLQSKDFGTSAIEWEDFCKTMGQLGFSMKHVGGGGSEVSFFQVGPDGKKSSLVMHVKRPLTPYYVRRYGRRITEHAGIHYGNVICKQGH